MADDAVEPTSNSAERDGRSRRAAIIGGVIALVAVVAIAGAVALRDDGASGTEPVESVDASTTTVIADDPTAALLVSCGSTPYPREALETAPTGAEDADEPAAAGLRDLISNPDGIGPIPADGWRKVLDDGTHVVFVHGEFGDDMVEVELEPDGDGGFDFQGSSMGCGRASVDVPGRDLARVELPGGTAPGPDATSLPVLVTAMACSGGEAAGDRMGEPTVVYGTDTVGLLFTVDPLPPGSYTCPGNPPEERTVELTEPLGDRTVVDLSSYPPRPAIPDE